MPATASIGLDPEGPTVDQVVEPHHTRPLIPPLEERKLEDVSVTRLSYATLRLHARKNLE
jgi:hypothetical protein